MAERKPRSSKPKSTTPNSSQLEKAIALLQSVGMQVTPITNEEFESKQQDSLTKLGVRKTKKDIFKQQPKDPEFLVTFLHATHSIGNETYGPGEVRIPFSQDGLFRTLVHQDRLAIQARMDTKEYNPISNTFIIEEGRNSQSLCKYLKRPVTQSQFDSGIDTMAPAISAGAMDVAGYNPTFLNPNRTF